MLLGWLSYKTKQLSANRLKTLAATGAHIVGYIGKMASNPSKLRNVSVNSIENYYKATCQLVP